MNAARSPQAVQVKTVLKRMIRRYITHSRFEHSGRILIVDWPIVSLGNSAAFAPLSIFLLVAGLLNTHEVVHEAHPRTGAGTRKLSRLLDNMLLRKRELHFSVMR